MSKKKVAYENPLVPNARLRQMYRAILRAHLLGQALPPSQRALTAGREAVLVNTVLDLTARDYVLDAFASPVVDFIGGMSLTRALRPHAHFAGGMLAGPEYPYRIPALESDAVAHALGIALHLKAAGTLLKKARKAAADFAVAVAYTTQDQGSPNEWKAALTFAAQNDLPVIFVLLPLAARSKASKSKANSAKEPKLRAIAHRASVPAIPVDAADPVALYRVAQESIGHARIGGGPALIECVAFPAVPSRKPAAIAHIEEYILSRGIATRAWMDREAASFTAQLIRSKSASK